MIGPVSIFNPLFPDESVLAIRPLKQRRNIRINAQVSTKADDENPMANLRNAIVSCIEDSECQAVSVTRISLFQEPARFEKPMFVLLP
jgi:hypothetical protein